MILRPHVPGAYCYEVGDELGQESLAEAIRAETQIIAEDVAEAPIDPATAQATAGRIVAEMTSALVRAGDTYRAPDGVVYSLEEEPAPDPASAVGSLAPVSRAAAEPVVEEVLAFEGLPLESLASRRVVVRWSDGSEGEAIRYFGDEVLLCEGDVLGKTRAELRSLHFRRDRDWLQS